MSALTLSNIVFVLTLGGILLGTLLRRAAGAIFLILELSRPFTVLRFPNQLCTDKGRAINQQEPGWEKTLTGSPKEIYQLWEKYFRPRGYKLKVQNAG